MMKYTRQLTRSPGIGAALFALLLVLTAACEDRAGSPPTEHADHDTSAEADSIEHVVVTPDVGPRQAVHLTAQQERALGVVYMEVARRTLERTIRTVGRIEAAEHRVADVTPKIDGFVEQLFVGTTGESVRRGGAVNQTIVYNLFIMVKGKTIRSRRRGVKLIVEALLKFLNVGTWTTDECYQQPMNVKDKNLYSTDIDEMGLALWVIRWDQLVQIPYLADRTTLDDFAILYADYLRVAETDPENTISEQQIELETE